MDGPPVTCWFGVFLDAYKYSSKYLIFTLSVLVASVFMLWIYEKPKFHNIILMRGKDSHILSAVQTDDNVEENYTQNIPEEFQTCLKKKSQES